MIPLLLLMPLKFPLNTGLKVYSRARGERVTHGIFLWMVNFFSFLFFSSSPSSCSRFLYIPYTSSLPLLLLHRTWGCAVVGMKITYQPPTPPPLCCLLHPHRLSLFFLSISQPSPPFPIFFFFRWMCIYLLPIFIYGKRLKSAQVTIRCDGDATELKGNEKCREKKQQERRCHWNRPSFSNNFL